ncbi:Tis11/Cth1 [Kluyveromyces lactis]|nr:Tis11/Cth1 [Kluyveromyces lactis]
MNYTNYNHSASISSRSTQTSSVFSNENEDYDARIREIEEYYIKTLLNDDAGDDGLSKQQQQQLQPQFHYQQLPNLFSRSSFSSVPQSQSKELAQSQAAQQYQQQQQWFQRPIFEYQDPWPQKVHPKEPSLEVEINSQYRPANGIMPLTSENLRIIQETPAEPVVHAQAQAPAEHVHSENCGHNHPQVSQQHQHQQQQQQQQQQQPERVNKQLYKTELCESFATKGTCKYGNKCQFAHGLHELKLKERSNNFRTKPCVNWQKYGYCRYGKRCCFKHGDDEDIQVYMKVNMIKKIEDEPIRKNLHADVKALQKMTW